MKNKNSVYFRYTCCGVILFIAGILNFNPSFMVQIHGSYPNLILILLVVFAMFEHAVAGAFFGLFAGILYDQSVTNGNGIHALLYMLIGFIIGFLYQFLLQNNLLSCLITAFSVLIITSVIDGLIKSSLTFNHYFYNSLYSFVLLIILYYCFRIALRKKRKSYLIRSKNTT